MQISYNSAGKIWRRANSINHLSLCRHGVGCTLVRRKKGRTFPATLENANGNPTLQAFLFTTSLALLALSASADLLDRYAELQAVGEAINDPDPLAIKAKCCLSQ